MGGEVSPGDGLGTLTLNKSPVLNGTTVMEVSTSGGVPASALLAVSGNPLTYGGTLEITNAGTNALQVGDTFTLFSASSISGSFANVVTYSPGQIVKWNINSPAPGHVTVASLASSPPALSTALSGTNVTISWPAGNTGWRLLVQTNHLNSGLSTSRLDWGTVAGSQSTNQMVISINPAAPSEFYQLVYP
jgi:hypothetical protein